VLGRNDIGSLEVGKCADFFAVNLNRLDYTGALADPIAAVVFCAPVKADYTVVGGETIVKHGAVRGLDLDKHIIKHNNAARKLAQE
jgi:cytosine/adenosine deaminase-related metal-dependent hydrolase